MNLAANLISRFCIWSIAGGLAAGLLLKVFLAAFYSSWFPGIFAGMFFLEIFLIFLVEKLSRKVSDTRLVHVYMAVMGGKMLLALIFITTYAFVVAENTKAFAVDFILLYLLFLVLESWTFIRLEKYLKEKRKKK